MEAAAEGIPQTNWAGLLLARVQWALCRECCWQHSPIGCGSQPHHGGSVKFPNDLSGALTDSPVWVQFLVFLVVKDILEWCIHNLLHRIPWLWEFHKLHHSIEELDWIGNMRFHWMEIVVYRGLTYFPLFLLGVDETVILWIAVFSTLIGHLNHSNLNLDWGIFRYVLNSPRLHVWHHDVVQHQKSGQNFGIVFSLWDFLFGTAYLPARGEPARLGFERMAEFPQGLLQRLIYPFWKRRSVGVSG